MCKREFFFFFEGGGGQAHASGFLLSPTLPYPDRVRMKKKWDGGGEQSMFRIRICSCDFLFLFF